MTDALLLVGEGVDGCGPRPVLVPDRAARTAVGGDCEHQAEHLLAALGDLPPSHIRTFDRIQWELLAESYRWDLWGACSLLIGTDSEDGFLYFRGWLLGQGRAVFEAALRDPDSLADHPKVRAVATLSPLSRSRLDFECEMLLGVASSAYETATGEGLELTANELADVSFPHDPAGEPYPDDVDGLRRQYPRLWTLLESQQAQ